MSPWIALLTAGIVALFLTVFFGVSLCEKQRVKSFAPTDPSLIGAPSRYFSAVNRSVAAMGFHPGGIFARPEPSKMYSDYITLWAAPDGLALLVVYGGKLAGIPVKKTVLITDFEDGAQLQTCDDFDAADLSGLVKRQVILNAGPEELYASHQQDIRQSGKTPRFLTAPQCLEFLESISLARYRRMTELGILRPADPEGAVFRYTVLGALRLAFRSFRIKDIKGNQTRMDKKRPGDA